MLNRESVKFIIVKIFLKIKKDEKWSEYAARNLFVNTFFYTEKNWDNNLTAHSIQTNQPRSL